MSRINVPIVNEYGELVRTGWFDDEAATEVVGATYWDGNNRASVHVGANRGQCLYRSTKSGRFVLYTWSAWTTEPDRYMFVDADQAREWLIRNESDDVIAEWFGPLAEEDGPDPEPVNRGGRPVVGEQIAVAYPPDLLAQIGDAADRAGLTRAAWLRAAAAAYLNHGAE